ncbi:MFS transporter, partial [Lactiplantibacillus plantarum]|uniref:MFS transporter n=2 Tax=Lactiplantibacillus plantarum TaxID=1590 RepID=UPI000AA81318
IREGIPYFYTIQKSFMHLHKIFYALDLFGLIVPIVAIVLIAGFFFMANVLETSKPKLDFASLVLSTIGFGSLLYGFSSVGDNGWTSTVVLSTLIIGVIFIIGFIWRQLTMENPFLQLRVFKHAEFTIAAILSSVANMAMVGAEMVIPLYLQIIHGFSAFESGLSLLAGALMMGVMSPITGRAFDRFGAKRLAILGMFLLTIGTIPFAFITRNTATVYIVVLYAVRMFGIAMVMMPATTAGMNALPVELMGHGTAVNNTTRQIASSIGTAILTSVLSNVTDATKPAHSLIKSNPLGYQNSYFNATLNGYHAAFWVAVGFSVVGLVVAFFMKGKQHSVKPVMNTKEVND